MLLYIKRKPWLAYGALLVFMVGLLTAITNAATDNVVVFAIRPVLSQIASLSTPERAIAAKIAAEFNTNCADGHCSLTDALNLGEQCSPQHKALLNQAFGNTSGGACLYQLNAGRNSYALRTLRLAPQTNPNQWHVVLQYMVSFEGNTQCFDQERDYRLIDSLPWRLREEPPAPPTPCPKGVGDG